MDAGERYSSPESQTKDFIAQGNSRSPQISVCSCFLSPQSSGETQREPGDAHNGLRYRGGICA